MPSDRHSRRVALLKRILPAIGLGLLLLIAAWPRLSPLWDRMRLAAIDLREARELRMINPRYAGIDRLERPYVMTAATGRQVPDRDDLMSLEQPRADLKMHSGAHVVVTAVTGIYQSQVQLLDLFDNVNLIHDNGSHFLTQRARVNLADSSAEGHDPVEGHGPSGDIAAQGFRLLDKGDTIIFTGAADLLLKGAHPGAATAQPPTVPAAVAKAAAQIETAAKPLLAEAAPKAVATAAGAKPRAAAKSPAAPKPHAAAKPHRKTPARAKPKTRAPGRQPPRKAP